MSLVLARLSHAMTQPAMKTTVSGVAGLAGGAAVGSGANLAVQFAVNEDFSRPSPPGFGDVATGAVSLISLGYIATQAPTNASATGVLGAGIGVASGIIVGASMLRRAMAD